MIRSGITNTFINTIVTALHGPDWEMLLQRQVSFIGVDAMLHLLTETSIFMSLPHECLCQVTGDPLIHLTPNLQQLRESQADSSCGRENGSKKRQHVKVTVSVGPRKKQKLNSGSLEFTVAKCSQKQAGEIRYDLYSTSINWILIFLQLVGYFYQ
ncbi:hypothetical protein BDQ17DRAFT_1245339 [Cyathus striatus]|nr:hypothetical protein BDQ17DRAFT_1245339 [Cyathus striatus]